MTKTSLTMLSLLCTCVSARGLYTPSPAAQNNLLVKDVVNNWLADPKATELSLWLYPDHAEAKTNLTGLLFRKGGKMPRLPDTIVPVGLYIDFKREGASMKCSATTSMSEARVAKILGLGLSSHVVSSGLVPPQREWTANRISADRVRNIIGRGIHASHGRVSSISTDVAGSTSWASPAKLLNEGLPQGGSGCVYVSWDGPGIQPTVQLSRAVDGSVTAQLTGVHDALRHLSDRPGRHIQNDNQAIPANMPVYALTLPFSSTAAAVELLRSKLGRRNVNLYFDFDRSGLPWQRAIKTIGVP